ncbi:MAG TPA: oligosaccharide flippase family protein, partial [Hyphomicrobiaceae bacterium]|nr:oligosaccharide flippase family protein [Hyphomicrobiaceae bacterium]
ALLSAREFTSCVFLIQQKDLAREEVQGAFTLMLGMSAAIAAVLAAGAPSIAAFYAEPRLVPFLRVAAVAILLDVAAAPLMAIMRRDMQFATIAVLNIANVAVFAVVTVTLAVLGFSHMSFAWGWAASTGAQSALAICLRPSLWVFRPVLPHWGGMLKFGVYNGLNVLLYRVYETIPTMVFGRVLSLDAVGLYNRALLVCQLPDKIVLGGAVPVILPALAAEVRAGGDLGKSYVRAVSYITAVQWPALIVLAVLAHPVVLVLLGHQWLSVVPLVQILALASLFSFTAELNYPVLVSLGAMRDLLLRALIAWPPSALVIAGASHLGLTAAALSFLVIVPFQAYVSVHFVRRHLPVRWRELAGACGQSAVVTLCSAFGPLGVVAALGFRFDMPVLAAVLAGALAAGGWLAGVWLTRHPFVQEIRLAGRLVRDGLRPLGV